MALPLVVALGMWLRFQAPVNAVWRDASGGAIYVMAMGLGIACVWPRMATWRVSMWAGVVTGLVEFAQAIEWEWLRALRGTRLGRLALGTSFDWGDFGPYGVGVVLLYGLMRSLRR